MNEIDKGAKTLPREQELPAPDLDLGVIAAHGPELDVRRLIRVLENRLRGLVEVVQHRLDVFVVAVRRVLQSF